MEKDELICLMALTQVPKVGNITARNLIAWCGSASAVFRERKHLLLKIEGIGQGTAESIINFKDFKKAEDELAFAEKNKIDCISLFHEDYPRRLKEISDAPLVLFRKGKASLNSGKMLAVVGTRKPTDYGKNMCRKLIEGLSGMNVSIVSGLAMGIDACAHKAALENGMDTIGVLAHGLSYIYPPNNRDLAAEMVRKGSCLLTEYSSKTMAEKNHFPDRNRIVAGMSDAVLIIETGIRGGALITGEIAFSYNRDVFAVPGRTTDEMSAGCNHFIKTNKAAMVQTPEDICYVMGWEKKNGKAEKELPPIFLDTKEIIVVELLKEKGKLDVDKLCLLSMLPPAEVFMVLLSLEMKGAITCLPGKMYELAVR